MNEDVVFFWGGMYSQWYKTDFVDKEIFGVVFNCAEQYMMYNKAMLMNDEDAAISIITEKNPKHQKAIGRRIKNFDPVLWDKHKFDIVVRGNYLKFTQNSLLLKQLIEVDLNKRLVEASPYDTIWGIGMKAQDAVHTHEDEWKGQNLLGKAIMEAREKILKERND